MRNNAFIRNFLLGLILFFGFSMAADPINTLIFGGGSSHDFEKWFHLADKATLEKAGAKVAYTEKTSGQAETISNVDVLYLSNNKPFSDQATKDAIFKHVQSGKGLLLVHPALWYNWNDWPEYNRELCAGGSRGHDRFGSFKVDVTQPGHPVMKGVSKSFEITDELYYFERDPEGPEIEVLATAHSKQRDKIYPIIFIVQNPKARIVGITLGHDGLAHHHEDYKKILVNALNWVADQP